MKVIKKISLGAALMIAAASAISITAANYLYFHRNGEVVAKVASENVNRVVLTSDKKLQLVDENNTELYKIGADDVDSMTFLAPMPKADLLNIVFHEDGTAEDVSPNKFKVEKGGTAKTEWNADFNRYMASISDNDWGNSNVANSFYRIDYTSNTAFKNALTDGHTLEVLFCPEYDGAIANKEAKVFASHEQGGTGIMIKTKSNGAPDASNSITFLPNVSKTTTSTWRWGASQVVPESGIYYHVVGVWDKTAKKVKVYVNGELKNEVDIDGTTYVPAKTGATQFCIGGDATVVSTTKTTGVQNGINGKIVLARIYDDPLTDEQAERLYQDVQSGIKKNQPMIESVTILENVQVKPGVKYPIYGTGFEDGDKIELSDGDKTWTLDATLVGEDGVQIVLPADIATGDYSFSVKRGARVQKIGEAEFHLVDNFNVGTEIVAHRGYWAKAGAAQNSRASLQNAIDMNAYGSETDVWLTADNVLVINHDSSISGVSIQNSNYADIKDLTLSNGETIPTFDDFLQILKNSKRCKLIIEIKTHSKAGRTTEAALATVEAVKKAGLENMVEYIAFNYPTCEELAKLTPKVTVQYLCDKDASIKTPAELKEAGNIHLDYKYTMYNSNPTFVEDAHKLGLTVNVWTLSSSAEIGEWINKGADFITGDTPVIGMKYLEYYNLNK